MKWTETRIGHTKYRRHLLTTTDRIVGFIVLPSLKDEAVAGWMVVQVGVLPAEQSSEVFPTLNEAKQFAEMRCIEVELER